MSHDQISHLKQELTACKSLLSTAEPLNKFAENGRKLHQEKSNKDAVTIENTKAALATSSTLNRNLARGNVISTGKLHLRQRQWEESRSEVARLNQELRQLRDEDIQHMEQLRQAGEAFAKQKTEHDAAIMKQKDEYTAAAPCVIISCLDGLVSVLPLSSALSPIPSPIPPQSHQLRCWPVQA